MLHFITCNYAIGLRTQCSCTGPTLRLCLMGPLKLLQLPLDVEQQSPDGGGRARSDIDQGKQSEGMNLEYPSEFLYLC